MDALSFVEQRHVPNKGRQTRAAILDAALGLASHMGLEGLSIGTLADLMGMSKSGVFAHFGSREVLQISVVREYHVRFEAEVFQPCMKEPRGLPRLRARRPARRGAGRAARRLPRPRRWATTRSRRRPPSGQRGRQASRA